MGIILTLVMLNIFVYYTHPQFLSCQSTSIPFVSMYSQAQWKTLWILIRWLRLKLVDVGLQLFKNGKIQVQQDEG